MKSLLLPPNYDIRSGNRRRKYDNASLCGADPEYIDNKVNEFLDRCKRDRDNEPRRSLENKKKWEKRPRWKGGQIINLT